MNWILMGIIAISFLVTFFSVPYWIRKAKQIGLLWEDMNKPNPQKNVAGSGGITVVMGAIIGIFLYLSIQTFVFQNADGNKINLFAIVSSLLLVAGVGLIDDLFGWRKGGLSKRSRMVLVLFAAVPLMAINAGVSTMSIPFWGNVNFGLLYPLVLIPLGILGATTTYNFLAGMNGLETSQGIIILSALSIVTYLTGNPWLSVVGVIMVASLFGFYFYNKYPAKVFPGDSLTYSVGALIAIIAILGNIEKIAVFFFIPYIIETGLKARGKLIKHSFGKSNEDGSLELRYEKIYGLTHLAIHMLKKLKPSRKVYEYEVVWLINGFQILIILLGFWFFI